MDGRDAQRLRDRLTFSREFKLPVEPRVLVMFVGYAYLAFDFGKE